MPRVFRPTQGPATPSENINRHFDDTLWFRLAHSDARALGHSLIPR